MKRELGREDATVIATAGLAGASSLIQTDGLDVVDGSSPSRVSAEIYRRMQELG